MDLVDQLILVATGLGAGLMGGLLGIGGSVVMIPIIVHVVGRDQHFAQGAAMLVNVFVAIPAALRHHKGGRVRKELVQWFAPTTVLFILCGVWLSNQFEDPKQLGLVFGVFMLAEVVNTMVKVIRPPNDQSSGQETTDQVRFPAVATVGALTGVAAGLLGIGGGVVSVPLMTTFAKVPLRLAIATSSAAMILSAPLGAYRKVWTLPEMSSVEGPITAAITTAAYMAVGAVVLGELAVFGGVGSPARSKSSLLRAPDLKSNLCSFSMEYSIRWIRAVFAPHSHHEQHRLP